MVVDTGGRGFRRQAVDRAEAEWLLTRLHGGGRVDPNETALLRFIKTNAAQIDPVLTPLLAVIDVTRRAERDDDRAGEIGYNQSMGTLALDALKLARKLQAGGFTAQQAETAAEAIAESLSEVAESLPTRNDLKSEITDQRPRSPTRAVMGRTPNCA